MSAPVLRGYGSITVGGSSETSYYVDLPARKAGDILVVYTFGVNAFGGNAGRPDTPAGFEELHVNFDTVVFECVFAARVLNPDAGLSIAKGDDTNPGSWMTFAFVVTNVTPDTPWRDDDVWKVATSGAGLDPVTVSGDDRLVVYMLQGFNFFTPPLTISGPPGFDPVPASPDEEPQANSVGCYYRVALRTAVTDTTMSGEELYYSDAQRTIGISFIGLDSTPLPAVPHPNRLRLGCADSYTAFVTANDYRTTIDAVGWTNIEWGRVLDEASTAKVVIPDLLGGVSCCIPHGGIEPWAFGLLIERNDVSVWNGPITKVDRDPGGGVTTLMAGDFTVRYKKRFAVRAAIIEWLNTEAGTAFAGLMNTHARLSTDSWFEQAPQVFTGASVNRDVYPRGFEMASAILGELADSAIDYFVMNGDIYIWEPGAGWRYFDLFKQTLDGPYNTNYDFVYGLFTAEAFSALPSWSMDGMSMVNFQVVTAADTGEEGFREFEFVEDANSQLRYGVLDGVEPSTIAVPEDATPGQRSAILRSQARTRIAQRSTAPPVLSGGKLSQDAPIDVPNLRPGSIWQLDVFDACYGQLLTAQRLKSVTVTVTTGDDGVEESIVPTLYPLGYEGGEF